MSVLRLRYEEPQSGRHIRTYGWIAYSGQDPSNPDAHDLWQLYDVEGNIVEQRHGSVKQDYTIENTAAAAFSLAGLARAGLGMLSGKDDWITYSSLN